MIIFKINLTIRETWILGVRKEYKVIFPSNMEISFPELLPDKVSKTYVFMYSMLLHLLQHCH